MVNTFTKAKINNSYFITDEYFEVWHFLTMLRENHQVPEHKGCEDLWKPGDSYFPLSFLMMGLSGSALVKMLPTTTWVPQML